LYPFLNGEDLTTRPDQSPSRWVINFHDWPLNRSAVGNWNSADEKRQKEWLRSGIVPSDYPSSVATDYPQLLAILEEKVKPERTRKNEKGIYQLRYPLYIKWWIYGDKRPELYNTISQLRRVLVTPLVSKYAVWVFAPVDLVFSHALGVVASHDDFYFSVLQSSFHEEWARQSGSSLETRMRYTPSDCFDNFPFPLNIVRLGSCGNSYYTHRQSIMTTRQEGLTKTYNRFHNPEEFSADISELRSLHVELNQAVAMAYDWQDIDLNHGFHETKQGIRFTISEAARLEILDRLLDLNHKRHAEEEAEQTAHPATAPTKKGRKKKVSDDQVIIDI
jgi:hypothetical protein